MNYFEVFELPENLIVDAADLEKRFYALSRKWHPDRFARAAADERQRALDVSAELNDAYRILRDPITRTEYFLDERGIDSAGDAASKVPPELLDEVFELNIALEELKAGDSEALPALRNAHVRFRGMLDQSDLEMQTDFAAWDAAREPRVLLRLRGRLNRRKYIANLVRDTEQALEKYVSD